MSSIFPGPLGGGQSSSAIWLANRWFPTSGLKILKTGVETNALSVMYDVSEGILTPTVYQVPTGKTLKVVAVQSVQFTGTGTVAGFTAVYADNNAGTSVAIGSLTNPKGLVSGAAGGNSADIIFSTGIAAGYQLIRESLYGGYAPASKYVYCYFIGGSTGTAVFYGYEE